MYIGNGVTKNFPLPEGYDGSVVILRIPGGKGIRMTRGEGYEVKEGSVNFYAPVPSGVEVIFDELSVSEMMSKTAGNYVVIYGDGTTKEVSEDPVILLAEAQKVLNESKLRSDEVIQAGRETVSYITGLIGTLKADLEGRLDGYSLNAEEIAFFGKLPFLVVSYKEKAFGITKRKLHKNINVTITSKGIFLVLNFILCCFLYFW